MFFLSPELTLSTYTTSFGYRGSATITVSYLGTGTISVEPPNNNTVDWFADYNSNTRTITVGHAGGPMVNYNGSFTVSLSASPGYTAATAVITNNDPNSTDPGVK